MAKKVKHTIYTTDYDEEIFREDYEEWLEMNDFNPNDFSIEEYIQDSLAIFAQDEYSNLSKECGQIIAIADLGLWDGRYSAYQLSKKGKLNAIFDMIHSDDYEIFVEGNDVKAIVHHHDGTNYITFREVREGRNIQRICDMLYNQEEVSNRLISVYTKPLGKLVASIYGWQ